MCETDGRVGKRTEGRVLYFCEEDVVSLVDRYGPWAVIAGASEGTGRALARRIAAGGVPCILLARREAPLGALAEQIFSESKVECVVGAVDLATEGALPRVLEIVGPREVGLFVSNAGADTNGAHFLDGDLEAWLALTQRNAVTTLRCCHAFAGPMRARGRGGILLVNSGACYGGASGMAVYAATKAFTLCFGEALWSELRPSGVDVLNLVLGRTDTPAFRALLAKKGMAAPDNLASADDVARVGLERLPHGPVHDYGVADDVAAYGLSSAAARRERVLRIDAATAQLFGRQSGRTP
jgi:short-subunit dehydrogenase